MYVHGCIHTYTCISMDKLHVISNEWYFSSEKMYTVLLLKYTIINKTCN